VASKVRIRQLMRKMTIPLATGAVGYRNDPIGIIRGTFTGGLASGATDERVIGRAIEDFSQTAGDTKVQVVLDAPVNLEFGDNDPNTPIVIATDFLKKAYWHPIGYLTLTDASGGVNYAYAGIVYIVHAQDGVGVKSNSPELQELLS
jgi:hypothetical protein